MTAPDVAAVARAEATEQELVQRGREIEERTADDKWELGEAAHLYVSVCRYGTDAEFAEKIGSQQQRVNECRLIFARRQKYRPGGKGGSVSWKHLRVSLPWDDAEADECLQWAAEMQASVAEMQAWRRARRGEKLKESRDDAVRTQEPTGDAASESGDTQPRGGTSRNRAAASLPAPVIVKEKPLCRPQRGKAAEAPGKRAGRGRVQTSAGERRADLDTVVSEIRTLADDSAVRSRVCRALWRLLRELDPDETRRKKPTVAALTVAIPDDWDAERRELAIEWGRFKQQLPGKARVQSLAQWEIMLRAMERYPVDVLRDAIETAIVNGWQGWEQESVKARRGVSARVRTKPEEVVYRDFD